MQRGVENWAYRNEGNIFKIDHLFLTFLLKIIFQSVASKNAQKKSPERIKSLLSFSICFPLYSISRTILVTIPYFLLRHALN